MTRGSTWHIWDFHLHTPYSVLNNQFGDPEKEETWEQYISEIERVAKEKGIVAIGITDYFTIEGYKRVREYKRDGRLKNLLIFPNIEFRVDKIIYRTKSGIKGRRLNLHVLFSPEIDPSLIEEHFLHDLNFVFDDHPFDRQHTRKLKYSNLEDLGNELRQQHDKFKEKSPIEIGMMNAIVSIQEIERILKDDGRFDGKYLVVLAEEDLSSMHWNGQDHATRKQLLQMSHAVFSSNEGTRNFLLGKEHDTLADYLREFKSLKPCIWGSDSHGFEQRFLEPDGERYCWIKSEVSWEGLKQILYEPEDRVRIQKDNPEPQKSVYTLDKMQIDKTRIHDSLTIDAVNIPLNHNLVAIIGGRGSGKTALLDLIARCFPEGGKLDKLENSFYHRITQDTESKISIPVTLHFRSGEKHNTVLGENEVHFTDANIVYLTQNHLDEYTADPTKLNEHIIELVFGRDTDRKQEYDQFGDSIDAYLQKIQSLNLSIEQLQGEVEEKLPKEEQELLQKQGALKDLQGRLEEKLSQEHGRVEKAEELTNQLSALRTTRDLAISLHDRYKEIDNDIRIFHEAYGVKAASIEDLRKQLLEDFSLSPVPVKIEKLDDILAILQENIDHIATAVSELKERIENAQKEVDKLEGIDGEIAQLQDDINRTQGDIEVTQKRIEDLKQKEERVEELDKERIQLFAKIFETVARQRLFLQTVIDRFEKNEKKVLSDISFSAKVDISKRRGYIERIADKVDKRSHSFQDISNKFDPVICEAEDLFEVWSEEEDAEAFQKVVKDIRKLADDLNLRKSVTESEFFNVLFSPFFTIGLQIKFNNRSLESLSMGERAVVLLKILLGLNDKPLLIDQPEEHLDNRYIYDELVPAFRQAKTKRQIIIATHNANLVVNTDAEQIIVAKHESGVISYDVGALETPRIREEIKTILEGGDLAFRKREEKYGYIF